MTTVSPSRSTSTPVPLALWPVAQTSAQVQTGRSLPIRVLRAPGQDDPALGPAHRRRVSPSPVDSSSTPCAASAPRWSRPRPCLARRRRRVRARWSTPATANLDQMFTVTQRRPGLGPRRRRPALGQLLGRRAGTVDLICTSPPTPGGRRADRHGSRARGSPSGPGPLVQLLTDRAALGHARGRAYEGAMAEIYAACFEALAPGRDPRHRDQEQPASGSHGSDLVGRTVALCQGAGFRLHPAHRGPSTRHPKPACWWLDLRPGS